MLFTIPMYEGTDEYVKRPLPKEITIDTKNIISIESTGDHEELIYEITFKNKSVCIILYQIDGYYDEKTGLFEPSYQIQYFPKEFGCKGEGKDDPYYIIFMITKEKENNHLYNELMEFIEEAKRNCKKNKDNSKIKKII